MITEQQILDDILTQAAEPDDINYGPAYACSVGVSHALEAISSYAGVRDSSVYVHDQAHGTVRAAHDCLSSYYDDISHCVHLAANAWPEQYVNDAVMPLSSARLDSVLYSSKLPLETYLRDDFASVALDDSLYRAGLDKNSSIFDAPISSSYAQVFDFLHGSSYHSKLHELGHEVDWITSNPASFAEWLRGHTLDVNSSLDHLLRSRREQYKSFLDDVKDLISEEDYAKLREELVKSFLREQKDASSIHQRLKAAAKLFSISNPSADKRTQLRKKQKATVKQSVDEDLYV